MKVTFFAHVPPIKAIIDPYCVHLARTLAHPAELTNIGFKSIKRLLEQLMFQWEKRKTGSTGMFFGFGPITITAKVTDKEKTPGGTQFIIFSMVK